VRRAAIPEITRTAAEVAALLEDGRETACLDVREIVLTKSCALRVRGRSRE